MVTTSLTGEPARQPYSKSPIGRGKKTRQALDEISEDMRPGIDFAKAAAGKNASVIQIAATKVNANCDECHSIFKE